MHAVKITPRRCIGCSYIDVSISSCVAIVSAISTFLVSRNIIEVVYLFPYVFVCIDNGYISLMLLMKHIIYVSVLDVYIVLRTLIRIKELVPVSIDA